jgi:hypothetical protein
MAEPEDSHTPISGVDALVAMREYLDQALPRMPATDPLKVHLAHIREAWRANELRRALGLDDDERYRPHMYARTLTEPEAEAFRLIQQRRGITEAQLRAAMGVTRPRMSEILYKLVGRARVDFV